MESSLTAIKKVIKNIKEKYSTIIDDNIEDPIECIKDEKLRNYILRIKNENRQ